MRSVCVIGLCVATLGFLTLVPQAAIAHPSAPSPARWTACEARQLGESCSYSDDHHIYRGTCRDMRGALACVRNRPIEHR